MKGATHYRHVYISLDQIEPHPEVQRAFDARWAERIAKDFDPDMFGALAVVPNGVPDRYWVFDGQHRRAAALTALGPGQKVPCHLYPKLPLQRTARLFRGLNNFKIPRFFDQFAMRLKEGEKTALAISALLAKHHLTVTNKLEEGGVRAVGACDAIYNRSDGPALLESTVDVLCRAWGGNPDAYHQNILRGVATLLRRYKGKIDLPSLVRVLSSKGTPVRLLGDARAMGKVMGISTAEAATRRIVLEYNKRRSTGRLEE